MSDPKIRPGDRDHNGAADIDGPDEDVPDGEPIAIEEPVEPGDPDGQPI
jgi:hypothetical protein